MGSSGYVAVEDLPPRPDPSTGLPRPPRAPGFLGRDVSMEEDVIREQDPTLAPSPPPGQGPVLVWYWSSPRGTVIGSTACVLCVAVLLTVTRGTAWLSNERAWPVWVFIAAFFVYIYLSARRERFNAGADWLAKRKKWVRLYDLEKVTCHGYPWGAGMYMRDSGGRSLRYRFTDLSTDRLLWDLTYNGILHSVIAGGAETNSMLRKTLVLPLPAVPPGTDQDEPWSDQ